MINRLRMPDINLQIRHQDLKDDMGGTTGKGFGGGCVVGEVSPFGRLVQFFPRVKTVFPGSGTYPGCGNEEGRGYG